MSAIIEATATLAAAQAGGSADGLINAAAAVVGALIGAVVGAWATVRMTTEEARRQRRTELTLQLYTEFNSDEMLRGRRLALESVNAQMQAGAPQHIKDLEAALEAEEFHALMLVLFFFEKLELLRHNGYLDMDLAPQLFKPHFSRWYDRLEDPIKNRRSDMPRWTTVLDNWHSLSQHMYQHRFG